MTRATLKNVRQPPWIFRTYAGYSTAEESNRLFRNNLAKGQTGLSIAFDLPTQTGYDCDHPAARGEVGKVGVPISHIGDMRALMSGIALSDMNTSMTINATAPWLLALYAAVADEQGVARGQLKGTTQNDIIKEYLSRGTYIFPPAQSLKLTADVIAFCAREMPKWNPVNVCSYHLQEAGATHVEEIAFTLAAAIAILDAVRGEGAVSDAEFPGVVSRISFFVNAGMKFITEICKMQAFADLWDEICRERYGVQDAEKRRFRYGVQVNSLGLTEQQPENNAHRILIEMLGVVLSKNNRARAIQLPAWNEALGLPRPWDQQWSLRMQQILAFETDILDYDDIFAGSHEIGRRTEELKRAARDELGVVVNMGGAIPAVESGHMKQRLVQSNSARLKAIENGEAIIVGVNAYQESETSELSVEQAFVSVKDDVEYSQCEKLKAWRRKRNAAFVRESLERLKQTVRLGGNVMGPSIDCAKAGVTTGEWGQALREVLNDYRAPTGVIVLANSRSESEALALRQRAERLSERLGTDVRLMIGKPGLDGHSNGAEQIALRAMQCGMEVRYDGIRLTPAQIVDSARALRPHVLGLSILSGSHVPLVREVMAGLRKEDLDIPVVVGGIIPPEDVHILKQLGVRRVYTPKDFQLNRIIAELLDEVESGLGDGAA
ncbi:MAG TPA: methylmalonyl-CoA mutase family protein [Aestuariivirgaceae bacterium]